LDDEYTPEKTRTIIKQFLNDNIDIILCPMGSPTLESYLDLVREKKVLVLFPNTGAPIARKSDLEYIINWRLSYDYEGEIITKYTLDKLNATKAVMFYQDDAFGHGLLQGAQRVLKKRGITNWIEVSYGRNDVNFEKQVNIIKQENPNAILFFSSTVAARGLITQLEIKNLTGTKLLGNSDMAARDFKTFTKQKGITVINPNVVPNPKTSELEIVQEFRKKAKYAYVPLDPFILEAYLAADLTFHILSKIDGPITKDAIVKIAESFKNYPYKGLTLDFNPQTRELSRTVWIDNGEEEWIEIK
jgi:ABC-type branched-subunit amino acid transport system substrate-binding protein